MSVFLVRLDGVSSLGEGEANPTPFRASRRGKLSTGQNLCLLLLDAESGRTLAAELLAEEEEDGDGPNKPSTPESDVKREVSLKIHYKVQIVRNMLIIDIN